jgi:hypothetical protein
VYLTTSALGQEGGTLAPLPPSNVEFADPLEASLVAQMSALRSDAAIAREQQELVNDAHSLLAGFVGGAAAGYFGSKTDRLRNAAIGGVIGGVADLAVLALVSFIMNATRRT